MSDVYLDLPGVKVSARHPEFDRLVRLVLPFIEAGASDREAFHALVSDDGRLNAYRARFGNKPAPRKQPSLFDMAVA